MGVGVGDWSLNAPGAHMGMCGVSILRLGPLSVGLAAKSQSGKANFETCAASFGSSERNLPRLAWPLGVSWCVSLTYQAIASHTVACQFRMYSKYPPPHSLTDKAGLAHALPPCPHLVGLPCLTVTSRYGRCRGTWSNSPCCMHWRVDASSLSG